MKAIEDYLATGGNYCPFCGGTNLASGIREFSGTGEMTQEIMCVSCRKEWLDVFQLINIREVTG